MVGLSVAVVSFGAAAVPTGASAGASDVGTTRAEIQTLQAEVLTSATRVRTLTLAYEDANTQAGVLAGEVASDQAEVAQLTHAEDATAATLRSDAIMSYTGSGVDPTNTVASASVAAIQDEYLQVASGNLSDTADQYRIQALQVASAERNLAAQMRASRQAAQATAAARQAAEADALTVQDQLISVQSQLSRLLAAQAQAEAAAQAAQTVAPPPTQGLPVNHGLVNLVSTVVTVAPPAPAPAATGGGNAGGVWLQLRECESGDNYQENSGNGYYGAYQFSPATWTDLGFPGRPDLEPPGMQDAAAQKLQAEAGWSQWPACSAALGLH